MRSRFIYLWTLPYDIIVWFVLLILWLFWGTKLQWIKGIWFEWKEKSIWAKTWASSYRGCCLGHGGFYAPGASGNSGIDTLVEKHEHIHLRQCELIMIYGSFIAAFFSWTEYWYIGCLFWLFSWPLVYIAGLFHGWLTEGSAYRKSLLEESAVALAREWYNKKL